MIIKDLHFHETSCACPEQYDVVDDDGNQVGYVRLRYGHLTCQFPYNGGEKIYEADIGDGWIGSFKSESQRKYHLNAIAEAIHCCLVKRESNENW